jgi:predicted Fe-Mo cluster-binding NifX family protein
MKICFPSESDQGLKSALFGHFGSAPFFTLVESESNLVEVRDNRDQVHAHGACHPVAALEGLGVQAVVCGGMGLRALQKFEEAGITVYRSESQTVAEALLEIISQKAGKLTAENACSHHHGCR